MSKFPPLSAKVSALLHGADYNPEQWENYPDIIDKDIAMMKQAKCNVMSVGIFSWVKLEPSEGEYNFSWLDELIENFMLPVSIYSWRRQVAHVRLGCRRNILKFYVSGVIGCLRCMVGVITTV